MERSNVNINDYLTDGQELDPASYGAMLTVYYLFVKQPAEPKIVVEYKPQQLLDADQLRVRINLKALLMDSEVIEQYRSLLNDENDLTNILQILAKQLAKKQQFGNSQSNTYKYDLVNY